MILRFAERLFRVRPLFLVLSGLRAESPNSFFCSCSLGTQAFTPCPLGGVWSQQEVDFAIDRKRELWYLWKEGASIAQKTSGERMCVPRADITPPRQEYSPISSRVPMHSTPSRRSCCSQQPRRRPKFDSRAIRPLGQMGANRLWVVGQEAFHWLGTSLGESLPSIQSPSTQPLGAGHLLLLPPPLHLSLHREPSSPTPTSLREPRRGFLDHYQLLLSARAQARTPAPISSRT